MRELQLGVHCQLQVQATESIEQAKPLVGTPTYKRVIWQ